MSDACRYLHKTLSGLTRYKAGFDAAAIPQNGLYFLFENGEPGHGADRIVRVGTHSGQNNLAKRIKEHLFTENKDRSIFRKHIGRCLLTRENDPFLATWEIDLTTRAAREKHAALVDKQRLKAAETAVSAYMNTNFSFVVLEVADKEERLSFEEAFICTIAECAECAPSPRWLGQFHPTSVIKEKGLWNVQGFKGKAFSVADIERILRR